MEYIYMAKVVFYSKDGQEELTDYIVIIAYTFTDAQEKICQYYGEDALIATDIVLVSPFGGVLRIPSKEMYLKLKNETVRGAIW